MKCERSGKAVLDGNYAICPECHHVVKIGLVNELWTFLPHDDQGLPLAQSGREV